MKKITLNKKVFQILSDAVEQMDKTNNITYSPLFPFVVCFEWVNERGEPVHARVEVLRTGVCQAWNDYFIEDKESGSFDKLQKRLKHLVSYLEVEVINGRIK